MADHTIPSLSTATAAVIAQQPASRCPPVDPAVRTTYIDRINQQLAEAAAADHPQETGSQQIVVIASNIVQSHA